MLFSFTYLNSIVVNICSHTAFGGAQSIHANEMTCGPLTTYTRMSFQIAVWIQLPPSMPVVASSNPDKYKKKAILCNNYNNLCTNTRQMAWSD